MRFHWIEFHCSFSENAHLVQLQLISHCPGFGKRADWGHVARTVSDVTSGQCQGQDKQTFPSSGEGGKSSMFIYVQGFFCVNHFFVLYLLLLLLLPLLFIFLSHCCVCKLFMSEPVIFSFCGLHWSREDNVMWSF